MTFEEVFNYDNLIESYRKCKKGVAWKGTVQFYGNSLISNTKQTLKEIKKGTFKSGFFFRFSIMERGKVREIKSVKINERVVQRCLCDYCLVPTLTKHFIYDNSACIKGKGMHFALKRLKHFLHNYYLKYGDNQGYILQFDFKKYFDSISHEKLIEMVNKLITDKDLQNLYARLVNDFGGNYGLGLGSQISQISALYYPHEIDNTFSNDKDIFAYARYMDDGYLISNSKEKLIECLNTLKKLCTKLEINLNEKKTTIFKMTTTMEFLKSRIKMLKNGKIIVKPNRKNITRNRRKLKKLKEKFDKEEIDKESIKTIFRTTYGNFHNFNAYQSQQNYKIMFLKLFGNIL